MSDAQVVPHKVTKPIQLLAAWLVGLILLDGAFLSAAAVIDAPTWAAGLLVVAAVLNVPLFIGSLFLLQTRFRPEMQEDQFYSEYLDRMTGETSPGVSRSVDAESWEQIHGVIRDFIYAVSEVQEGVVVLSERVELALAGSASSGEPLSEVVHHVKFHRPSKN